MVVVKIEEVMLLILKIVLLKVNIIKFDVGLVFEIIFVWIGGILFLIVIEGYVLRLVEGGIFKEKLYWFLILELVVKIFSGLGLLFVLFVFVWVFEVSELVNLIVIIFLFEEIL